MILRGALLIAIGSFLVTEHTGYEDMLAGTLVWAPVAVGICIIVNGFLGIYATIFNNQNVMLLHIGLNIVLLAAAIMCGSYLVAEIGFISKTAKVAYPLNISNWHIQNLNTYQGMVFNRCCNASSWSNASFEVCRPPATTTPCYNQVAAYQIYNQGFDDGFCSLLSELHNYNGSIGRPLVGDPAIGGCGFGSPKGFQYSIARYADDNMLPAALSLLVTEIILFTANIIGCTLLFRQQDSRENYEKTGRVEDSGIEENIVL